MFKRQNGFKKYININTSIKLTRVIQFVYNPVGIRRTIKQDSMQFNA